MSTYIFLDLESGHGAMVDVGVIAGVIYPANNPDLEGTKPAPIHLILRGGETLPGIIGKSAREIVDMMEAAKQQARLRA